MSTIIRVRASPSLALIKYWGKKPGNHNLPATTSIAVTLAGLDTRTEIRLAGSGAQDSVTVGDRLQPADRYTSFFDGVRRYFRLPMSFTATSHNSFPSAAGLASSSSGFAALALGCARLADRAGGAVDSAVASSLARLGSASAARAVYGGFTLLEAGASHAVPLYGREYWPALRVLVVVTSQAQKADSSRSAMERTRRTSPFYRSWLNDSKVVSHEALTALESRDLERLGSLMRLSYLRMHASAMAADPPALYWLPASVLVIKTCEALRARGIGAWETMDAGPQVKILCLEGDLATIRSELAAADPALRFFETSPGPAPDIDMLESSPDHVGYKA